jgi:hypothetical protein
MAPDLSPSDYGSHALAACLHILCMHAHLLCFASSDIPSPSFSLPGLTCLFVCQPPSHRLPSPPDWSSGISRLQPSSSASCQTILSSSVVSSFPCAPPCIQKTCWDESLAPGRGAVQYCAGIYGSTRRGLARSLGRLIILRSGHPSILRFFMAWIAKKICAYRPRRVTRCCAHSLETAGTTVKAQAHKVNKENKRNPIYHQLELDLRGLWTEDCWID